MSSQVAGFRQSFLTPRDPQWAAAELSLARALNVAAGKSTSVSDEALRVLRLAVDASKKKEDEEVEDKTGDEKDPKKEKKEAEDPKGKKKEEETGAGE